MIPIEENEDDEDAVGSASETDVESCDSSNEDNEQTMDRDRVEDHPVNEMTNGSRSPESGAMDHGEDREEAPMNLDDSSTER